MARPLEGIRVLDLTIAQQGPYATMLMAEMGAEVIKIEQPGRGDIGRALGIDRRRRLSCLFLAINRGKKSLTLDLKSPKGREIVLRLARHCDVAVHNFRPGFMEKLGLAYEDLKGVNPRLIYAKASAFGSRGPLSGKPGNDILAQAMSGLMSVTGEDGSYPLPAGVAIADHVGAMALALGIVTALLVRQRTGVGQEVEVSLLGSMLAAQSWELTQYLVTGEKPAKAGRGHPYLPLLWHVYRTADGYLAIGGLYPERWPDFCRAIGQPELSTDERFDTTGKLIRGRQELNRLLDGIFAQRTSKEWLSQLEAADIFCAPVYDYGEVAAEAQAYANGYLVPMAHPKLGDITVVGPPIRFSETPASIERPEPELGQHSEEVLRSLGYSAGEVQRLRNEGVI